MSTTAHGFGRRLQALRTHRGFSEDALTHKLGLAPGTVARWERELESPQRPQLLMLSTCLRVAVDEIVGVPDSLSRTEADRTVRSLGLHRFLATDEGARAKQHKLDGPLRDLPDELSAEQYRQISAWLTSILE